LRPAVGVGRQAVVPHHGAPQAETHAAGKVLFS
jgi:hypothetical protein